MPSLGFLNIPLFRNIPMSFYDLVSQKPYTNCHRRPLCMATLCTAHNHIFLKIGKSRKIPLSPLFLGFYVLNFCFLSVIFPLCTTCDVTVKWTNKHKDRKMICKNTIKTVQALCQPAVDAGLIPSNEFKELIKSAKQPDQEGKEPEPELKLFTRKEAAAKLKVSTRQLDRYHEAGYLRYVRIGTRALRIPAESLFSYMKNGISEQSNKNLAEDSL